MMVVPAVVAAALRISCRMYLVGMVQKSSQRGLLCPFFGSGMAGWAGGGGRPPERKKVPTGPEACRIALCLYLPDECRKYSSGD